MSPSFKPASYLRLLFCMFICYCSVSKGRPAYTDLSLLLKSRPTSERTTDIHHLGLDPSASPMSSDGHPVYKSASSRTNAKSSKPTHRNLAPGKTDFHHENTISNNLKLVYEPVLKRQKESTRMGLSQVVTELRSYFKDRPGPNLDQILSEMVSKLPDPYAGKLELPMERQSSLGTQSRAPEKLAAETEVNEATILHKFIAQALAKRPVNPVFKLEMEKTEEQKTLELIGVVKSQLSSLKMSKEEDWAHLVKQARSLDSTITKYKEYARKLVGALQEDFLAKGA